MPDQDAAVPPGSPAGAAWTMLINIGSGWTFRGLHDFPIDEDGRGDWIRTSDLHTPSVMRYQAALRPDLAAASRQGYPDQGKAAKRECASGAATAKSEIGQVGWPRC